MDGIYGVRVRVVRDVRACCAWRGIRVIHGSILADKWRILYMAHRSVRVANVLNNNTY